MPLQIHIKITRKTYTHISENKISPTNPLRQRIVQKESAWLNWNSSSIGVRPSWKGEKVSRGDFLFIYPQSNHGEIISANFLRGRLRRHPWETCGKALCPVRRSDTIAARVRYFQYFPIFSVFLFFKVFLCSRETGEVVILLKSESASLAFRRFRSRRWAKAFYFSGLPVNKNIYRHDFSFENSKNVLNNLRHINSVYNKYSKTIIITI